MTRKLALDRHASNRHRPPIIVLGMHRSGTSLVSRILENLGIFMGKMKDTNNEAYFFRAVNDWILRQCGGSWKYPDPVIQLLDHVELRKLTLDYIRLLLKSPWVVTLLGWDLYSRYRDPVNLDVHWGWKDPRNTYTLPFWLDIFPEARVIHICRHGVDVANSLKTREEGLARSQQDCRWRLRTLYGPWPKGKYVANSLELVSLERAFCLWEQYIRQARRHMVPLSCRTMEVKFEDLLAEPYDQVSALARFAGIQANRETLNQVAETLNPARAYAFRHDPELRVFAETVNDRLRVFGYTS